MALWLKSVNGSYELLKRGRKKEEGRGGEKDKKSDGWQGSRSELRGGGGQWWRG